MIRGQPEERAPLLALRPLTNMVSWGLVGILVLAGSQAGVLVVLARLSTPEALGAYALAVAVGTPVWTFLGLQLPTLKATDVAEGWPLGDYVGLRLLTSSVGVFAICVLTKTMGLEGERAATMVFVGVWKSIDSLAELAYGHLQLLGRVDQQAKSQAARGVASLAIVTMVLSLGGSAPLAFATVAAGSACILVGYDVPNGRSGRSAKQLRPRLGRRALLLGLHALPLGGVVAIGALRSNVPRYAIEASLGSAPLGVYAAIAGMATIGSMVMTAVTQATTPRLAMRWQTGDMRDLLRVLGGSAALAVGVGGAGVAAAVFAGGWILTAVYGAAFAPHARLFSTLMLAGALTGIGYCLGAAATAFRAIRIQVVIHTLALLIVILVTPPLVERHGLVGAALGELLSIAAAIAGFTVLVASALRRRVRPAPPNATWHRSST
jgi:O-antigen/teichoic acid export membrane protein